MVEVVFTYEKYREAAVLNAVRVISTGPVLHLNAFPVGKLHCGPGDIERIRGIQGVLAALVPMFPSYVRILSVMDGAARRTEDEKKQLGAILNVSLSYGPGNYDENEPMNVATRAAANNGIITVIAVGNDGPAENTLNPWAVAPWVVGVGAASRYGTSLWKGSSRGIPGDKTRQPDVVAWGENVPIPESANTNERLAHGTAAMLAFLGHEPRPDEPQVLMSGTSLAAPVVGRLCAFLHTFIEQMAHVASVGAGFDDQKWYLFQCLRVLDAADIAYEITPSPIIIRKALRLLARPIDEVPEHAAGAGFVSDELVEAYLFRFSMMDFRELFGLDSEENVGTEFAAHAGRRPLVPESSVRFTMDTVRKRLGFYDYPVVFDPFPAIDNS